MLPPITQNSPLNVATQEASTSVSVSYVNTVSPSTLPYKKLNEMAAEINKKWIVNETD